MEPSNLNKVAEISSPQLSLPEWVQTNFLAMQKGLNGAASKPINLLRQSGYKSVQDSGFPSTKQEDWKYTNIAPMLKTQFEIARSLPDADALAQGLKTALAMPAIGPRLVFVNGKFSKALSDTSKFTHKGLKLSALAESFSLSIVEKYLGKFALNDSSSFVALNTAFVEDGSVIYVEKGTVVKEPIEIIYFTSASKSAVYPRLLVVAEENSQISIIERFIGVGEYLNNYVAEIIVGNSARVDHYKVQEESSEAFHISRIETRQDAGSVYENHSFSFGSKLIRNEINPILEGEKAYSLLHGLNILNANQHVDNHTVLDHAKPNCDSREWYKGIYSDKSKGVFCGTIIVRQDAQKTNAFQSNQSLLLSEDAESSSKPQLKIWADDVKCSHGATVGQLDSDAMFYLRSRGIPKKEAQGMLITAFAGDILGPIKIDSLKQELGEKVLAKLNA